MCIYYHLTNTRIFFISAPTKASTSSTSSTTTSESNPADKKLIESLRESVSKLTKQLEQSDGRRAQCDEECNRLKKEAINANIKIEMLNKKVSSIGIASADSEQSLKEFVDVCM